MLSLVRGLDSLCNRKPVRATYTNYSFDTINFFTLLLNKGKYIYC